MVLNEQALYTYVTSCLTTPGWKKHTLVTAYENLLNKYSLNQMTQKEVIIHFYGKAQGISRPLMMWVERDSSVGTNVWH